MTCAQFKKINVEIGKRPSTQMNSDYTGFFKELELCATIEESLKSFDKIKKVRAYV